MPKYKLENGQIVDTTNYSETSLEYFILENPSASVIEDFQEDSANVINPSTESKNTGLNAENGSSVYGEYLDEEGNLGFKEKPYETQVEEYKNSYEDLVNATGAFKGLENTSVAERKKYANQWLNPPKLTKEVYNRSSDAYELKATDDAKELFSKNIPSNFSDFDNVKEFDTALQAGIVNTISDNPIIKNEISRSLETSKPVLDALVLDLQTKYDTTTPEGLELAEDEYKKEYKNIVLRPVTESSIYKKTVNDLSIAAGDVAEEKSKAFGRYDSNFLSTIDKSKAFMPDFIPDFFESVVSGGTNILQGGRQTVLSAEQGGLEDSSKKLKSLLSKIDSGEIKEDSTSYFGGDYNRRTGASSGLKKGTVKEHVAFLKNEVSKSEKQILESLEGISESQKYQALFNKADLSDGIGFTDIVRTVGEALPQLALGTAGAATGNPLLTGLGLMGIFSQEYGSNYYTALEEGVRKDNPNFDKLDEQSRKSLMLEALKEGKYADKAEAAGYAIISAGLERLGATKIAKAASKAAGLGKDLKAATGSLYRGEIKKVLGNAINSGKRSIKGGAGEFLTESAQGVVSQLSIGSQLNEEFGSRVELSEAFEEGIAGGIVGAVIPGGASVGLQSTVEIRNTARDIATRFDLNSNLKSVNGFFKAAEQNLKNKLTTNQLTENEYNAEISELNSARNIGFKIPKNFNESTKKRIFDIIVKKNKLENDIQGKEKALVEDELKEIKSLDESLAKISATEKLTILVKKSSEGSDVEIIEAKNNAEAQLIAKEKGIDIGDDANTTGYASEDSKVLIVDMERAADLGEVNTASHEFLHKVLFNTLYSIDEKGNVEGKNVVRGLATALKSELSKLNPEALSNSNFAERLELYNKQPNAVRAEEVLTLFSDALFYNEIAFNESVFTPLKDFVRRVLQNAGWKKIKFNTGKDVYNFLKDYNRSIQRGKLGRAISEVDAKGAEVGSSIRRFTGKENIASKAKESKATGALDAINNIVPNEVKTKADFQKPKVFNKAYEATIGNGVISNYVKGKATSTEMYENTMDSIRDRLMNYNPATDRKTKSGNPITFGEFIFANTNFAIADAKKKLAIEGEKRKKETSADTKEAVQIAAPEATVATIDKPKYKKIKDSNVIPKETIDNIQAKVLKTVRVLKSKIDEDVSINKTVTPLVAEIKKDMGKQADIDFKKAMGGKKDGKLRSFLIKNKKAILTNMTTTWLMQAMPGAVQKQVNGSFTSDWQGKNIDREKVTTQQAGRTSGNEIVRRLPNAVNNLSDADFLGYVLDKKGDPIRGRKESLAKAMAEEVSLELFDDAISDPDSDIRKAFEDNQGALGVLIAENIAQDVSRQVERGSVKFSKTGLGSLSRAESKKWNEGKEEFFNSIYKFNGAYKENNVLQAHIDVYGSEFTEKQHKNIAKQFFKPLEASAKGDIKITEKLASVNKTLEDFLEDIANDIDGDVTIQQLTNSPESVTAVYEDWNNVIESRTVVIDALKDGNIDVQTAVAFFRSTFANSGRIGRWVRNKINKDKTHRSDLFSGKKQIINALNQAGYNIKNITATTIEFKDGTVEKRKYNSAVSSAKKYLGNYDVKAEKENADAAWNFTTKILEGLKGKDPKIQAMIMSAMNSGTNTSLRAAAPVLGRPTVLPSKNTKDYTPEHAVPARVALLHMYEYFVKGNKDVDIDALKSDYRVIMLPKSMDKVLTSLKLRQSMIAGYIPGESNWSSRYYNFNTRGKVQYAIESLEDGSVEGQSYADYYKEKNKPIANTVPLEVIKESKPKPAKANISLNDSFNKMIERQKGVESYKEFSKAVAEIRGKKVGKYKFFISPAAEDFRGLTQYVFAGKGKQGEADQKFFEDNLMTPYFEGVSKVESERQVVLDDTKGLLKMFKPIKKKINKYIEDGDYTYDAAIRVYLWNKAGIDIPGLSKRDQKKLNKIVVDDVELSGFAEALLAVSRQDSWPKPSEYWLAQTTLSDLNALTEKTNRKKYLNEFIENVDVIFSETNLNKVEALYGKPTRRALENSILAMKSGSNRANQGQGDEITSRWNNWVNSSIGTIMFFNRRSAILQTLSAANFINWSDNNPLKAGLAFANQPQYWKDFAMIFNSDKLKQRRGGLKSDVQESEIANAAKNSKDKAQAIISYMLKLGFTPTQLADSFAISLGGASLYRNRVNTYKKQGLDQKDAEYKAFADFSKLSDEAQQSGDPALVSQQQRSIAGRLVLSFQNTTMQYTRLMKKAAQDIKNGRGDTKTHISMIIYYGAVQNFIFSALSNSLFALIPGFDEDDEDDDEKKAVEVDKKTSRILNNMTDSVLRGTGIYGAVIATLKNTIKKAIEETEKGFQGDGTKVILEAANLAPAIGSKLRKIYSAYQTYQFDKDVIKNYPLSVKMLGKFNPSPTYNIIGNLTSATLNIPLDRAISEARALSEVLDSRNTKFQRLALSLGWRTWDVNAKNEEGDLIKTIVKLKRKQKKAAEKRLDKEILKQLNK